MNEEIKDMYFELAERMAERKLCIARPDCACPAETECSQCQVFYDLRDYYFDMMTKQKTKLCLRITMEVYIDKYSTYHSDYIQEDIQKNKDFDLNSAKDESAKKFAEEIKKYAGLKENEEYDAKVILAVGSNDEDIYLDSDEIIVMIKNGEVIFDND